MSSCFTSTILRQVASGMVSTDMENHTARECLVSQCFLMVSHSVTEPDLVGDRKEKFEDIVKARLSKSGKNKCNPSICA